MNTTTSTDVYTDGTEDLDGMTSLQLDLDGDGFAETFAFDFDADGVADAYDVIDPLSGAELLLIDTDGDGLLDTAALDVDGDGGFDQGAVDSDGDGVMESEFDPATAWSEPFDDPEVTATCETQTSDDVHGDPMAEIPYHQAQVGPNDCLPTSVAMVLTEITGVEVPQSELVDLANQFEMLGPDGMSMDGGVTLLAEYGVEAELTTGTTDDLRTMLDNGTPVIIGLDSDDLYGQGDGPFADDFATGHAVVITGIDDEAGVVYLNDPGLPDGAGVAIPIEDFEDAWVDSGNAMIVVNDDATEPTADTTGSTIVDNSDSSGSTGIVANLVDAVLLPLKLVLTK
ncbi:MAG: C39 family peptidase [Acidimicrobiia bacterium]